MAVSSGTAQLVVEIYVRDLKRSVTFYRALGFQLVRRTGGFAVLDWDGHALFLDEKRDLAELQGGERANVRILVADVDALWHRVWAVGARVTAPIADRDYGLRDFTVLDPDGFGLRFAGWLATSLR